MKIKKKADFTFYKHENPAKKGLLKQIAVGMRAAIQADKGKIKSRPAKEFVSEL